MANIQPLKVIFHEVNSKNFWLPQHPLFVGINLSDMKKLRLRFESGTQMFDLEWETFVGTLIHSRILETGYCNNEIRMFNKLTQFVNVFIVKETINVPKNYDGGVDSTCQFSEDTPVVKLYVTDFFVKHYGLNLLEKFYFKPVYCLPLEKVVFLAKSDECYNWATQDNWCDKLSLSVCNPKKVLCRSGDVLLGMPKSFDIEGQPSISKILDLIAVECQPVAQGILTINTTVVVTKFKPDDCRIVKKPQEPVISFNTMLHVFSYCNSLLPYGLLLGSVNPFSVAVHKNLLRHSNKRIFHVKMLPQLPKMYLLTKKDLSSIDPVNLIIVSDVSLKELNIVNGSWVKISMCICKDKQTTRKSWLTEDREPREDCSNYSRATEKANSYSIDIESGIRTPADKVRLVRVFSINTDESTDFPKFDIRNNVAFISPNLWFNLNKHPSSFLESAARLNCEGMLTQEDLPEDDLEKVEISPPYANELHLSLVQSPAYTSFSDLLLLSKYFEIDRYVVKGDILAIDSREDVSFHQELENSFYTKWPVVYYRVVLVEGPPSSLGYRAKKGHTYLYTVGTSQSYIPMTMDSFFSSVPYHPIWYSAEPPGILEYVEHLELLLTPFLNSESSRTKISPCILLSGPLGCGKLTIVKALSRRLNMHFYQVNCHEVTGDSPGSTENRLKAMLQKTAMFAPCILALKNVDAVGREKELLGDDPRVLSTFCNTIKCLNVSSTQWPVIIIATTSESHSKVLSVEFSGTFLHLIKVKPPNEKERKAMIEGFLEVCPRGNDVSASYLAQRTAGFVLGDFSALVSQAVWCAYRRIRKTVKDYSLSVEEEEDICYAGILLLQKDLLESLEFLQAKHAEAIGAPKIPNVHWEDIGGMSDIKQEILDTIQLPLQHPELMASGFHRSGLLLYGPPGTGKTLLAKAVATECSLNFLSVKGPELINMYVGQSEENVREVFQRARYATPCVIFFDELDSLAPHRGNSGDSGGVMDRVVSQLLAELDGLHKAAEVFVIGATNRPDLLDRALLRPGRFDRLVYVGIPEEKASRLKILKALTRKFTLGADLDLEVLVDKCPPSLTGADFYSLCSNAMMNALGRNIHEIETGRINVSDACMVIEERDFDVALQNLTPSVSPEELKKYQNIKL